MDGRGSGPFRRREGGSGCKGCGPCPPEACFWGDGSVLWGLLARGGGYRSTPPLLGLPLHHLRWSPSPVGGGSGGSGALWSSPAGGVAPPPPAVVPLPRWGRIWRLWRFGVLSLGGVTPPPPAVVPLPRWGRIWPLHCLWRATSPFAPSAGSGEMERNESGGGVIRIRCRSRDRRIAWWWWWTKWSGRRFRPRPRHLALRPSRSRGR